MIEKLTHSVVKFKQRNLDFEAPTTSKRSRLDSDVVANIDAVTLSDNHSDSGPSQCPSEDSLVQIDDEVIKYLIVQELQ